MVGIITYGAYIPRYRIKVEEIARVWGANAAEISGGLGVFEKAVPDYDENTATFAVEAARAALARREVDVSEIKAVYVGSESHPYAVKPTAVTVGEAIGATPVMTAADYEFACKAGTAAIQTSMGLVASGMMKYAVAIGADTAQGAPGDALEYTAAAGGAAYIIGNDDPIAEINDTCSFTSDTPDFWRREGEDYPQHGGRFSGEPGYFKHVESAAKMMMERRGTRPSDYDYAVFHQPNAKFPQKAAKTLGFTSEQIKPGLLVPRLGNTYSGAVPLGLAAVLDIAKPGDRIFVTSYGSGAGSDSFDITVTEAILDKIDRSKAPSVESMLEKKKYLDYAVYARHKGKIKV
ncbi:MAG TPA: hydroxymethylglutaryl-CoA synthase [Methanocorpusculum sp.]|jgi:hydroxymethylglutaryl-CoA synthase|nr:hydroxymethylglutaryl-CoA synthase [Methanocorpusculum sp.]MBR5142252.1 hydroxymethylglutaryl-CoA synthase [Methanocorpusculum sp.]HJJ65302.1 hydroxymethylglutaryl-CoA synthase [Methanocorpusculum sp.]HJJ85786.1 hydroxymethylglutaryl-CoA synthase [Methanocorpusculum sp.]HJJ87270.1 hydroxymethylglutaryl-CoA synthase [Methanocorpusculum sp.]